MNDYWFRLSFHIGLFLLFFFVFSVRFVWGLKELWKRSPVKVGNWLLLWEDGVVARGGGATLQINFWANRRREIMKERHVWTRLTDHLQKVRPSLFIFHSFFFTLSLFLEDLFDFVFLTKKKWVKPHAPAVFAFYTGRAKKIISRGSFQLRWRSRWWAESASVDSCVCARSSRRMRKKHLDS